MKDQNLAARAAWLSHIGGHTQSEIAKRLQVSSVKVHRLINEAHRNGLVQVFVEGVPLECLELEEALLGQFSLNSCTVAPKLHNDDDQDEFAAVGSAAALYLHRIFEAAGPAFIGVGKGRSLMAMVERLPLLSRPDLKFVSVSGSLTRNLSANPYDVVYKLVERTGGEGFFLPVPYITNSAEEKILLQSQKSVCDILAKARQANVFIIGIGSVGGDAYVKQVGLVTEAEWNDLHAKGAVGDVMGSFIDANGSPVNSRVNNQTLGLNMEELRGKKVIAVVGGASKGDAVLAALKTGIITDLIIGETAAGTMNNMLMEEKLAS